MISGAAGPGRSPINPYGKMTTLSGIMQIGDADLGGSRDGIVPIADTGQKDAVRRVFAKTDFTSKFNKSCKDLQRGLLARGMTPFFPEELAGPLADPIVGRTGNKVYPLTFDLDALSRKTKGSRRMFAAFAQGMGEAAESGDHISVSRYFKLVADAFMAHPQRLFEWDMSGRGLNLYVSDGELNPDVQYLANLVEGAKLLRLIKGEPRMWRVILPDALTESAVNTVDEALVAALKGFQTDLPTVVDVLKVAAKAFKNGADKTDSGNNGGGSGGKGRVNRFEMPEAIVSGTIHRV